MINWDVTDSVTDFIKLSNSLRELRNESLTTPILPIDPFTSDVNSNHSALHKSLIVHGIHSSVTNEDSDVVAWLIGSYSWDNELIGLLPEGANGIIAEIHNNCHQTISYEINGPNVDFLGYGSHSDKKFENLKVHRDLTPFTHPNFTKLQGH